MRLRHLPVWLLCLVILPACLLRPKDGGGDQVKDSVGGLIRFVDIQGYEAVTGVAALFGKLTPTAQLSLVSFGFADGRSVLTIGQDDPKTYCEVPDRQEVARRESSLLSVGELTLEDPETSQSWRITRQSDNRYLEATPIDPEPGLYKLVAEGEGDRDGFEVGVTMPYRVSQLAYQDWEYQANDSVLVKKGEDLRVRWGAPDKLDTRMMVRLSVIQLHEGKRNYLDCYSLESKAMTKGKFHMNIAAKDLEPLVPGRATTLEFSRLYEEKVVQGNYQIIVQGIRSETVEAILED